MACDDHCFPSSSLHHIGVGWKSQQTFFLEKLNGHISHEWSRAMSWPNPHENLIISRSLSFFFTLSHSYTILIFSSSHTFFFVVTTTEAHARARSFLFLGILISSIRETFFLSLSLVWRIALMLLRQSRHAARFPGIEMLLLLLPSYDSASCEMIVEMI